jgi:hypothetical protein
MELHLHSTQYALMAWCSVKSQGQLYLYLATNYEVPPVSSYFLPLVSKYYPQHIDLIYPQSVIFLKAERSSFTPIKNNYKIILMYILIFRFLNCWWEENVFEQNSNKYSRI